MNGIIISDIENGYTIYCNNKTTFCSTKEEVIEKIKDMMKMDKPDKTKVYGKIYGMVKGDENMCHVATHILKIKGSFDGSKWNEESLKGLVKTKIANDIDKYYHTDLELFKIEDIDNSKMLFTIDVWVFIEAFGSSTSDIKDIADKWLKDHIKEDGLTMDNLEVERIQYGRFNIILNDVALENL